MSHLCDTSVTSLGMLSLIAHVACGSGHKVKFTWENIAGATFSECTLGPKKRISQDVPVYEQIDPDPEQGNEKWEIKKFKRNDRECAYWGLLRILRRDGIWQKTKDAESVGWIRVGKDDDLPYPPAQLLSRIENPLANIGDIRGFSSKDKPITQKYVWQFYGDSEPLSKGGMQIEIISPHGLGQNNNSIEVEAITDHTIDAMLRDADDIEFYKNWKLEYANLPPLTEIDTPSHVSEPKQIGNAVISPSELEKIRRLGKGLVRINWSEKHEKPVTRHPHKKRSRSDSEKDPDWVPPKRGCSRSGNK